jgi:hypothetical protein
MRKFAPHLIALTDGDGLKYQTFHPSGHLMERFFRENAEAAHSVIVDLTRAKRMRLR